MQCLLFFSNLKTFNLLVLQLFVVNNTMSCFIDNEARKPKELVHTSKDDPQSQSGFSQTQKIGIYANFV